MMTSGQKIAVPQNLDVNHFAYFKREKINESSKPYLVFDAGGTLVFPDQVFLIQQAAVHGIELTQEQLSCGYYELIYTLDYQAYRRGRDFPYDPWPQGYACALLESIGIGGPVVKAINQAAQVHHKQRSLWTFTYPWVPKALDDLAQQGYRMSVISNSEDPTGKILRDIGLAHYFDRIFYSAELGVAKPDSRIFERALHDLDLQPADALYIGDVFAVDVRGANSAGVGAIHLDPLGLYAGWPGVHLPDILHLSDWLIQYAADPSKFELFPFGRPTQINTQLERFNEGSTEPLVISSRPNKVSQAIFI
jgi:HAD superfamily hydrolase (TIGR01549 family)